mmetsp:Transcript_3243/g.4652  ORF Transcript_3243/g.4652 Transcript_3243/m.4652 type:complete len:253 (-) Transcript_3243:1572-2330(-)|eukprot:CAMPEP_0175102686 /NCGR_PEP_ID=MMETSP0086_2-20121207/8604_1 /TAXON_ID=136419 /ORGANISM="Unknown Unknown, Strain D1" /LENGTH=252 /DNA_ID=CAMNT_0016377583 /DNA_START=140 /DNA_END=898 /DNA_ORIENTATION=+
MSATPSRKPRLPSLTQAAASHVQKIVARRLKRKSPLGSISIRFLSALVQLLRAEKIKVLTLDDLRQDSKESSVGDLDVDDPQLCGYCGTFSCTVYLPTQLKTRQPKKRSTAESSELLGSMVWSFGREQTEMLIHESVHAVRIHLSRKVFPNLFGEVSVWNFGRVTDPRYGAIEAREEWIAYTLSWYVLQFPVKRSLKSLAHNSVRFIASLSGSSSSLYKAVSAELLQKTQEETDIQEAVEQTLAIAVEMAST